MKRERERESNQNGEVVSLSMNERMSFLRRKTYLFIILLPPSSSGRNVTRRQHLWQPRYDVWLTYSYSYLSCLDATYAAFTARYDFWRTRKKENLLCPSIRYQSVSLNVPCFFSVWVGFRFLCSGFR